VASSQPSTIGRYEILGEVGHGTMGVVYEARDPALGRTVAVKTVSIGQTILPAEREAFERRFMTEAKLVARLTHPNIVVVHDVGRDEETGTLFMALEFLKGRNLAAVISPHGLEWRQAAHIASRLADALHAAHSEGIIHRDVKPANVMLLPSGEPKLMDFGIARQPASRLTAPGQVFGTPMSMSPEQALGQELDARSDLFSLGTVLHEALTGRPAFSGSSIPAILTQVVGQDPLEPSRHQPTVPPDVDYVLARAMAKRPSDRYPDGRTMTDDLEDLLNGEPPRHRAGWTRPPRLAGTLAEMPGEDQGARSFATITHRPGFAERVAAPALAGVLGEKLGRWRGKLRETLARWHGKLLPAASALLLLVLALVALRFWPAGEPLQTTPASTLAAAIPVPTTLPPTTLPPTTPQPATPSPTPSPRPTPEPARLDIDFGHYLKGGMLRVWIDDALVVRLPLESRASKKILGFSLREGRVRGRVPLDPGLHTVRLEVSWDDNVRAQTVAGRFDPDQTRTLEVRLQRLRKRLAVSWRDAERGG